MILAAIIPYSRQARLGLVVIGRDDAGAPRLLARYSTEVGRLVALDVPVVADRQDRPRNMRREVTQAHAEQLAGYVLDLLQEHGCRRLIIGPTRGGVEAERGRLVAGAVRGRAAVAGVEVEDSDLVWRGMRVDSAELEALEGWPRGDDDTGDTERRAALLALRGAGHRGDHGHSRSGGTPVPGGVRSDDHGDIPHPGGPTKTHAPVPGEVGDPQPMGNAEDTAPLTPSPTKLGPRTGAVDSGSARVGVTILEGLAPPLKLVDAKTFKFGEWNAKKRRRSFTDADVDKVVAEVLAFFAHHDVDFGVAENIESAQRSRDNISAQKRATEIARTQRICGEIRRALKSTSVEVHESTMASTWRSKVAAKGWRRDDPEKPSMRVRVRMGIAKAIEGAPVATAPRGVAWWDRLDGVDVEDAAGLAIYDVARTAKLFGLKPEGVASAEPRAAGEPKRRERSALDKRHNAERMAAARAKAREAKLRAREAAGCTCAIGGRHKRECKLFKVKASAT